MLGRGRPGSAAPCRQRHTSPRIVKNSLRTTALEWAPEDEDTACCERRSSCERGVDRVDQPWTGRPAAPAPFQMHWQQQGLPRSSLASSQAGQLYNPAQPAARKAAAVVLISAPPPPLPPQQQQQQQQQRRLDELLRCATAEDLVRKLAARHAEARALLEETNVQRRSRQAGKPHAE